MSGYWYPLLADKQNHIFKSGALFEQAYSIYKFDAKLRSLILSEISKIEVAVRTQIAYVMSHNYDGLWFTDSSLFKNPAKHAKTLSKIDEEYSRSDEDFVTAFKVKYTDHFPPSWITLEITSLGTLSLLYSNLKDGVSKRTIARYFGVADSVMVSWLHAITYAIFVHIIVVCGIRFWAFAQLFQGELLILLFLFQTLPTIRSTMYCA